MRLSPTCDLGSKQWLHSPCTVNHVHYVVDGDAAFGNVGGQNHLKNTVVNEVSSTCMYTYKKLVV